MPNEKEPMNISYTFTTGGCTFYQCLYNYLNRAVDYLALYIFSATRAETKVALFFVPTKMSKSGVSNFNKIITHNKARNRDVVLL